MPVNMTKIRLTCRHLLSRLFILMILLTSGSCSKFLSKTPNSTLEVDVDNLESITMLLAGAYPQISYFPFLEPRTDNVAKRVGGEHSQLNEMMYYWEDYDQDDIDTPLAYWNDCYRGIGQVNKALELLKEYPKTSQVQALYGEAFMLRAYLHFMLASIWCQPYDAETCHMTPGIPYLTHPEKQALKEYQRGTLKEVFQKVEKDLLLGISLVTDQYYTSPKFHFNKAAAYAFASRFYLITCHWEKVITCANYVLGDNTNQVLRHWHLYEAQLGSDKRLLHSRYNSPDEVANLLMTTVESRYAKGVQVDLYGTTGYKGGSLTEVLSTGKIGSCQDGALDFAYAYVPTASPDPVVRSQYIAKLDERRTHLSIGPRPRGIYSTNVLLSTDEVHLNRMEARVMLSDYDGAINDMKVYMREKFGEVKGCFKDDYTRTSSKKYDIFSPSYGLTIPQLAMVEHILNFRRKEFVHEGLRWFDIRRFHLFVKRAETSYGYYRPLEKDDPRKTLQIPNDAQSRGLEPNPRSKELWNFPK